mgnify:CR=1 FL=1
MSGETDRPILFLDSGIGGLGVLREARVLMPQRRFIYVVDDAAFPYGSWDEEKLRDQFDLDSMDFLDIVMELRKRFNIEVPEKDYEHLVTMKLTLKLLHIS